MTAPRQVLRGTTYLVTRRCLQRQFLLRPGKVTNQVFAYLLALAARRFGVEVHAYCVLSNHYHLVVTDPGAQIPAFQQLLDALVARAINALYGRWETFWAPASFSAVTLASAQDIIDKAAYVLANPVLAGLVRSGRKWPGLRSSLADIGGTIEVERPTHFFDEQGHLPKALELTLAVPPGFASTEAYRERLEAAVAEREAAAARRVTGFLGVARVLQQRPFDRPRSKEPRRTLSPRVASKDRWRLLELAGRLKAFLAAYRDALLVWREGKVEPVFPAGTYLMRVAHGVMCAGAG
jgi:putative transposase